MNSYQFLIIGSGPGGTTVLKTLLENGLNDVAVVEEGQREQKTTMGSFDELINKYRYDKFCKFPIDSGILSSSL